MCVEETDGWEKNIDVIIVTFNSDAVIATALQSLPHGVNVVVVDNGSADRSVAIASAAGASCITCEGNLGFGRASNLGAEITRAEFILFLNPDAVLGRRALEAMYRTAMRYPDAAVVGPRLVDGGGRTSLRYSSILHPVSSEAIRPPREPEATCCMPLLTGAALLCRRAAFEQVGGFDENIFLYHEDDDLCLRLARAGWSLVYEPAAEVFHASGRSSPQTAEMARFKSAERLLSRSYIARKYALPFDPDREWRKALKRLLIAAAKFDRLRFASAAGRLAALAQLSEASARRPHIEPSSHPDLNAAWPHRLAAPSAELDR